MDHNEQLKQYIQQQLSAGLSPDEIVAQLTNAGWPDALVRQGFADVQAAVIPQAFAPAPQAVQTHSQEPAVQQAAPSDAQVAQQSYEATPWQPPDQQQMIMPAANGKKRGRIRTGWLLFKQSYSVLKGNKGLLRYLLMTGLWVFIVTLIMVGIYLWLDYGHAQTYQDNGPGSRDTTTPLGFLVLFINYVLVYFIVNYYAAGLTANVLDIFRGERRPYGEYIAVAKRKAPALFLFSLIQATVGVILQYIAERVRILGWLISWLLGTIWSLATMFVVPILVTTDKNAPASIKDSIKFFKATWGENITAKVTVNAPLLLINLALGVMFVPLLFITAYVTHSIVALYIFVILFIVVCLTVAIIGSFANSLVNIALFYFARYGQVPPAFSAELLNSVFITQQKRGLFGFGKKKQLP
jgi:hypothetical protein